MTAAPLTTASVAQAGGDEVSVCRGLTAVPHDAVLNAPAFPCRCAPGDNLALHRALAAAPAGSAIVCDAAADLSGGYCGELMARDARGRGLAGLVITGSVRDLVQIEALPFLVFCLGTNPASCAKDDPGSVGEGIELLGAPVAPGDHVVADADGIVFVPTARWPDVEARARALDEREGELVRRMDAGERLADLLGLPPE